MSEARAHAHRRRQVLTSAQTEALVVSIYNRTIDPERFEQTYPLFLTLVGRALRVGRAKARTIAREYYRAESDAHGVRPSADPRPARAPEAQIAASMYASINSAMDDKRNTGADLAAVLEAGRLAARGTAKRLILAGGREYLLDAAIDDPAADGWARVTDADPCHFCAMLVGRGPVYARDTVGFRAHDKCGCAVRIVYPSDTDGGWSPQASALNDLWYAAGASASGHRSAIRAIKLGREDSFLERLAAADDFTDEQLAQLADAVEFVKSTRR